MTDALVTSTDPTPPRRRFLQLLALSAAAAGTVAASGEAHARRRKKEFRGVLVFRLSTRKHHSCKACKSHHKFKVFLTHALADRTRAHPGCDCPIVRHKMPKKEFKRLFGTGGVAASGVADLRSVSLGPS